MENQKPSRDLQVHRLARLENHQRQPPPYNNRSIGRLNGDDEFIVNAMNNKEEIKELLSVGSEHVCQKDDISYFRKRK